jgi:Protein of unknown function (DUF3551)
MLPRLAAGGLLAGAVLVLTNSTAFAQGRYCAVSQGAGITYEQCSFMSFEECRVEVQGLGGFCRPNPRYVGPALGTREDRPRRRARNFAPY